MHNQKSLLRNSPCIRLNINQHAKYTREKVGLKLYYNKKIVSLKKVKKKNTHTHNFWDKEKGSLIPAFRSECTLTVKNTSDQVIENPVSCCVNVVSRHIRLSTLSFPLPPSPGMAPNVAPTHYTGN